MAEVLATEATLSTLKVEIKALTVSGKQMTLAVFRQMPSEEVLDNELELRHEVTYWGIVRYYIKDEGALWAVMEHDGQLFRGLIRSRPDVARVSVNRFNHQVESTDGTMPGGLWELYDEIEHANEYLPSFEQWCKDQKIEMSPAHCIQGVGVEVARGDGREREAQWRDAHQRFLQNRCSNIDKLLSDYERLRVKYLQTATLSLNRLRKLTQLFIAV